MRGFIFFRLFLGYPRGGRLSDDCVRRGGGADRGGGANRHEGPAQGNRNYPASMLDMWIFKVLIENIQLMEIILNQRIENKKEVNEKNRYMVTSQMWMWTETDGCGPVGHGNQRDHEDW